MNQEQVKSMLLEIENTELEFTLIFSGKASKKVNGFYRPNSHEIILHNLNFKTDNMLIYTAIHEYAHHLITAKHEKLAKKITRPHTNEFWARFHGLLEIAEKKGFYVIGVNVSPELLAITENIKKNYLEKIGILKKELGAQLEKAHDLCIESNVRYVDYLDRCLQMSKKEASDTRKITALNIDPSLGYENMKMLASIPSPEKRIEAASQLRAGKSPDSVRSAMKREAEDGDETIVLEKEKTRLEKTIEKLSYRLEQVKEIIINGFNSIKELQPVMSDSIYSQGNKSNARITGLVIRPVISIKVSDIKVSLNQIDDMKHCIGYTDALMEGLMKKSRGKRTYKPYRNYAVNNKEIEERKELIENGLMKARFDEVNLGHPVYIYSVTPKGFEFLSKLFDVEIIEGD